MTVLTEHQLSIGHIMGTTEQHRAWHSSFPKGERACPFCELIEDLTIYFSNQGNSDV